MKDDPAPAAAAPVQDSRQRSREEELRHAFAASLGGHPPTERFGLEAPAGAVAQQAVQATVMFCDIRDFSSLADKLDFVEVLELLTQSFGRSAQAVLPHGGRHLKFSGDGLVAVFLDDGSPLPPARRAVAAALAVSLAAQEFRGWLAQRFADRGLAAFSIGIGVHQGEVTLWRGGDGARPGLTAVGECIQAAARLQAAAKELGWTVVASTGVLPGAGAGVQTRGFTALAVGGTQGWIEAAEIIGLEPGPEDRRHGLPVLAHRAEDVRRAVEANSEITARAFKGALRKRLSALKDHRFAPEDAPLRLKGFRFTRRLAASRMSEVFLAQREADGRPLVLKVLEAPGGAGRAQLPRFIQEYALLSRVDDPHVVRIYDHGFGEEYAYIAMEYFPGGDLRSELERGMPRERALEVTRQLARALAAVHDRGIIHRDLKPANVMLRNDGGVVLADFGAARSILQEDDGTPSHPGQGIGTPFYLSPEQASGQPVTPASDLYSLGVMLFEMLAGERPYRAETLDALLALHLRAPTPVLPARHADLQPVLQRLMAKRPQDRYPDARALLADLQRHAGPSAAAG